MKSKTLSSKNFIKEFDFFNKAVIAKCQMLKNTINHLLERKTKN